LTHKRIIGTLTGPIERRVLLWIASHTPGWVTPDLLTWLGVGSAVLISLCYLFAARYPVLLWVACFGFMLNWLFDSMDGTLARYRQIERPRYGYFIDHSMDAFSLALIFFSLGTTLYVRFEIAAVALAGYLLLEIHSALSTYTSQEFKLSYAYLGPTEMRLLAILSSIWVYFNGARFISLLFLQVSFFELILLGLIVLFYAAYILSTAGELVHLARLEPAAPHQVITRKPVGPKIKTEGEKVSRAGN
jgi:phosphatidylglycerophosphate synthase